MTCRNAIVDPGYKPVCSLAYQRVFLVSADRKKAAIRCRGMRCTIPPYAGAGQPVTKGYCPARTGKTKPLADLGMGPRPPPAMVTTHANGTDPEPKPAQIDDDQ